MLRAISVIVVVGVLSIGAVSINTDHASAPTGISVGSSVLQPAIGSAFLQPAAGVSVLNSNDTIKE